MQETAPEREDLKRRLLAQIDRAAPADVTIASSSSGLLPTRIQAECRHPQRVLIGHPFNPVYLLPLVEVVAGQGTAPQVVDGALRFYRNMGRLKGLSEREVVWRHAVPNAIAPTIQVIALNLAYLAGGIVVEHVFSYAGIGGALVDAVHNRDVPVVQALAMLIATVYVVLNVLADVAAILVSPRLRTSLR